MGFRHRLVITQWSCYCYASTKHPRTFFQCAASTKYFLSMCCDTVLLMLCQYQVPTTLVLSFNVLRHCPAIAMSVPNKLWYLSFNMMWYCTQLPYLPIAVLVPSVLSIVGNICLYDQKRGQRKVCATTGLFSEVPCLQAMAHPL